MQSETMFKITQFIRTLLPILATIGTITSALGFWRIFRKWHKPGILSLVPFARAWIFSKDSPMTPRIIYTVSDGTILTLTPVFYYLRAFGKLKTYKIRGFTVYIDKPMLIVTAIWLIAEVSRFLSSIHISENLCKTNERGKGWVVSWVMFPNLSKIIWGFSHRFIKNTDEEADVVEVQNGGGEVQAAGSDNNAL